MPFVPVPKDLAKVKNKLAFNLTKRQLIGFAVAGLVGIPMYFLTRSILSGDIAVLLMIAIMLPFFFITMYEKDGQPAEKVILNIIRKRIRPSARPYKTTNLYGQLGGVERRSNATRRNKTVRKRVSNRQ